MSKKSKVQNHVITVNYQNGICTCTTAADLGVSAVFTRATDYNTSNKINGSGKVSKVDIKRNASVTIEVGILALNHIKNELDRAKFLGANLEYKVGNGFLSKPIYIKGDDSVIKNIINMIDEFNKDN
jgi:hypothetical protein